MQKQNHLNFTEQLVVDYKIHPIIIKHESIQSTHCSIFQKKIFFSILSAVVCSPCYYSDFAAGGYYLAVAG